MDRLDDGVRGSRQEAVDEVRAGDRFGFGAAITPELCPDASESGQRSVVVEREPNHVFLLGLGVRLRRILGKAVERDKATVLRLQPAAPVRRCEVAGNAPVNDDEGDFLTES